MVDLTDQTQRENTVFDLAKRLGVRTQVVLDTLNSLGLEIDDPMASLDPLVEERLVARMVQSGQAAKGAVKALRKRRQSQQPLADDRILKEALGASQEGYSDEALPPQAAERVLEEKPSLLQWLGLRRARRREEPTPLEEPPTLATEPTELPARAVTSTPERPPVSEPQAPVPVPGPTPEYPEKEEMDLGLDEQGLTQEEESQKEEIHSPEEVIEPEPETVEERRPPAEESPVEQALPESLEGVGEELDLGDLESSEESKEEAPAEAEASDLEEAGLEELDDDFFKDLGLAEPSAPPEEEPEAVAPEQELKEESLPVEAEEEQEEREEEVPEEEEAKPSLLERIILRLNLSPVEMITAAVGSLLVMITAVGLFAIFYFNYSPQKAARLYSQGHQAYQNETLGEARFNTITNSFTRLLTTSTFADDPHREEAAYLLAKTFYRRAEEVAKTDPDAAKALYTDAVKYSEEFLREQQRIRERLAEAGKSPRIQYDWQEDARYHIALAYEKQGEHQQALNRYEDFLKYYPKSDRKSQIQLRLGRIYQDWAEVDENFRAERLQEAIAKHQECLADPSSGREVRVALHTAIAGINRQLYDTTKEKYRQEFLQATLHEYRKAQELILTSDGSGLEQHDSERDLALGLADTLLTMGQNAAALVSSMTDSAASYPASDKLRDLLTKVAEEEKTAADKFLLEAAYLYCKLLGTKPAVAFVPKSSTGISREMLGTGGAILTPEQELHVKSNLAEAYFHMGKFQEAMESATPVVEELLTHNPNSEYLGPLCYLLGDAAWELVDYQHVMDYYSRAREYRPFFPEESGERSNEAALKMANVYYSRGMETGDPGELQSAIDEYDRILREFPSTKWTYFTRYWLARTYERYAEVLANPNSPAHEPPEATKNFRYAYMQYQLALQARAHSTFIDKKHGNAVKDCYFRSGPCAYQAGDYPRARELLADAILWSATYAKRDPRAIPCRELLGDTYLKLGHTDQAIRIYEYYLDNKFLQQDARGDSLARVSIKLASACLKRFSYGQARDVLRRLVRHHPVVRKRGSDQVEEGIGLQAQRLLAQSYRGEAEFSFDEHRKDLVLAASREFQTLLTVNPNEHAALRALAEIHFDLAGPEEPAYYQGAADYYRQFIDTGAAEPQPDRDVVYYRCGDCCHRSGDYAGAVKALTEIAGTTIPADMYARALLLLGECYEDLSEQQTDKSKKQYYRNQAKQAYMDAINKNDPFVTQVATNKYTMMTLPPG